MSVSEQLTNGPTQQADPHSYPLVIIGFIPLIFAAAIIMTCGECMTGSRGKQSASRTPLMPHRQPKAKWWQFWRTNTVTPDLERSAGAPPPLPPQPGAVVSYGALASPSPPPLPPRPTAIPPFPSPRPTGAPVNVVQPHQAPIPESSLPRPTLSDVVSIIDSYGSASIPIFADFDGAPTAAVFGSDYSPRQAPVRPSRPSSRLVPSGLDATSSNPSIIPGNPDSFAHKYRLIRTLKPSSEGSIHLVACRETGKRCIIKQCLDYKHSDGTWGFPTEIDTLKYEVKFRHPNIINIVDTIPDKSLPEHPMTNMVTEFCDAGDLGDLIRHLRDSNQKTPRNLIFHFISSMIDALGFIHHGDIAYDPESGTTTSVSLRQAPIVHRDIKPHNVFMKWNPDSSLPDVILADFGQADLATHTVGIGGTPGFRAPEVEMALAGPAVDRGYFLCTQAGDVYAFGMSLYMLIFHHTNLNRTTLNADFARSPIADCADILALLKACLASRAADRPLVNTLYPTSRVYKHALQSWSESGGRLDTSIWPASHAQQASSSGTSSDASPHYRPASSVYSSPLSSVASGENLHQLRRVNGRVNLAAYRSNSSSSFVSQAASPPGPIMIAPASTGTVVQSSAGVFLDLPITDADQLGSAFSWDSTDAESEDGDSDPLGGAHPLSDIVFNATVHPGT
ncbi:hypothetical protein AC579_2314 [Pseudocercospora musae]|uniref:non-specific serine/threonine protein kinase n=1 Tax=Pseudocercospora musae TaxID=113226 RepID=A0A139I7P5_9PEZI|nr:hypothetical protein AC579_2314 [Pseudocercospora musae]